MAEVPIQADILIKGGLVVTMDAQRRVIENGVVATQGSHILWVGPAQQANFKAQKTIDASEMLVIPGLINVHSHLAMTLFRGYVDDMPLEAWLERVWKVEHQFANPENTRIGTQLALVEMIRGGTTCATDMYWQSRGNTRTAREASFRLVNGPSMVPFAVPGEPFLDDLEGWARSFIEDYLNDPLIHPCVQAHATYTTPPEMLELTRQIAEDYGLLFITHASESRAEVDTVRSRYGKTPVAYLQDKGLLGSHTLLAHCVHLTDDEIQLMKESGASVAHCPESNLKIGNGIARVPALLKAGVNVALGTDGAATNNDLDMFGEMRTAALIHKGVNFDPTLVSAEETFAMATINAAHAFGLADRIGSLEAGKLADITLVELNSANTTPMYNVYSHLVYAVDKNDVHSVFINGVPVMDNRQLLTLDEVAVKAQARAIARQVALG